MKPGIMMALIACLAMVSWATWYRFVSQPSLVATLAAVSTPEQSQAYYDELLSKVLASAATTPIKDEPLTATDLVGRQLISDYISLTQSGQATGENINALAERYANSIPTLIESQQASYLELSVVSNSSDHLSSYANQIEAIYRNYAARLLGIYPRTGEISIDSRTAAASETMSAIYSETAEKLKAIPVPENLGQSHLALINIYLDNASGMTALARYEADPATALAGLIAYKNSTEQEVLVLSQIQKILAQHGII